MLQFDDAIESAIKTILFRRNDVEAYQAAMTGKYDLNLGSDRFKRAMVKSYGKLADNLCPRVVGAVANRLCVKSIDPHMPSDGTSNAIKDAMIRTRFDAFSKRVHAAALRDGAAYVIATKSLIKGVTLHLQTADKMELARSCEYPDEIVAAVQLFDHKKSLRLNIYYSDRIERYILPRTSTDNWYASVLSGGKIRLDSLQPYTLDGGDAIVYHDFGVVPVVGFLNDPDERYRGVSELISVLPLQLSLNASLINLMSSMEAWSIPTRYILGLLKDIDPETGLEKMPDLKPGGTWVFGADGDQITIGQLPAADLRMAIESINDLRMEIARVSGVPLHVMQLTTSQLPSGESLKVAETALVGKARDRQVIYGNAWEDVFGQLLLPDKVYDLNCRWHNAEIVSQRESWEAATLQRNAGMSLRQILLERDYSDPEIDKILSDRKQEDLENQAITARLFNGGNLGNLGGV